jgi:hypothetical protein
MSFILAEDLALKTLLGGITVTDEKNNSRAVGVWFANPDVESRSQSYPYITIELINMEPAKDRQHSGIFEDNDLQGTIAPTSGFTYFYESPVTWKLIYQVTTYARHPRHDRTILAYLLNNVFLSDRGYLPVPNDLGTETGYRHLLLEEFVKRDTIEDNRRLHRSVFTVSVSSESDVDSYVYAQAVSTVKINKKTTADIPSGQQPI